MKAIKINFFLALFLFLSIVTIFVDYLEFFLNTNYLFELILGTLITTFIVITIRKKIIIENRFEKSDIIFYSLLITIFIITIVFPDKMYDTLNYHIYNQVHPFTDKINYNFFPSTLIQSFTNPFSDRVFYIFRFLLGYRMGLIINYLILIALYYEVKKTLKMYFSLKGVVPVFIATLSIISLSIIDLLDTYYIDLLSLLMMYSLFNIVLFDETIKLEKNNDFLIAYIAIISGIATAIKMTNLFFITALAIIFLIKNRKNIKNIKIKNYLCFIVLFMLPNIIYIYNTYKQTGNPVYPFYNGIFKSQYIPHVNWTDVKFGPKTIKEILFWPLIAIFHPERIVDIKIIEPIIGMGYLVAIIYMIIYCIRRIKKQDTDQRFALFVAETILFNLIWAKFMLGYIRYGLVILILNNIIIFIAFYKTIKNNKHFITASIFILLIVNYQYSFYNYQEKADFWSYNNIFGHDQEEYKYNLKKLFEKGEKVKFPKNSAWIVTENQSGFEILLNDNIPILYANYEYKYGRFLIDLKLEDTPHDLIQKEQNHKKYNEMINGKRLFTLVNFSELESTIEMLNNNNYYIKDVYKTFRPYFANYREYYYIFELERTSKQNNLANVLNNEFKIDNKKKNIDFYVGLNYLTFDNLNKKYEIEVLNNGNKIYSKELLLSNYKIEKIHISLDEKKIKEKIQIVVKDENNEINNNYYIINYNNY